MSECAITKGQVGDAQLLYFVSAMWVQVQGFGEPDECCRVLNSDHTEEMVLGTRMPGSADECAPGKCADGVSDKGAIVTVCTPG